MFKKCFNVCTIVFLVACVNVSSAEDKSINWKTHMEISYVATSGNTKTQTFASKIEIKKEAKIDRYYVQFDGLYTKSDNSEIANKWFINGRWEKTFSEKMFGFLTTSYLADKFSGYDYRISAGPGLGYDFLKTDKYQLKSLVTVLYYYDRFTQEQNGKIIDKYTAGNIALNYNWQILKNLKFKEDFNYTFSFEKFSKYFINSETGIETKINGHISFGVSLKISYQNQPPSDKKKTDTTLFTSLIVDF